MLDRNDVLVSTNLSNEEELFNNETSESAIDRFPSSLFNKKVSLLNEDFVGFIMKETKNKIVVFGNYVQRYDIPKSKTYEVGDNIILNMNIKEFESYEVDNYASLPK